ncbi:hypothetical protein O7627_24375 [Solwaraspora sp. WMMD1047]|uniref:hypothetical protein n=1 Tax=Solwaraspora sp. WMMD1047 TaxID=3016102 RepID=UPI002416F0A3|nr:hypothetical protein [Solwaraspora sp. WMMD1047]MDG4832420.1 hypothetical protein [Solwaraspora sp. WMMD1047]
MHHTRSRTLSALAGQIIGYRRNGTPIRLAAGGSGDGDSGGDGDGSSGDDTGSNDGDGQGADGDPGTGKTPKIKGEFDPDRALRDLGKARDDAKREKDARIKAEQDQQAKLDAVLVALGLKPDPKTDPAATAAKVAKELTDAQAQNRELRIENALYKLAGKAGGDVDALQDSRGFMKALADLDPTAADFEKSVTAAIRDAVKANPKLAAATQGGQGPARQGADHGGGNNGRQRSGSLSAAVSRAFSGQ